MAKLGRRPKVHLDRLKSRYGWSGERYQALMAKIIEYQSGFISRRIADIQKGKLDKHARTARKRMGVNLVVPDISEILPKRSVFIRKGAERGKLMTDALRAQLSSHLRDAVIDFIASGKGTMQGRVGVERGRLNPELVTRFEGEIRGVFASYAKRDPELGGVPRNVSVIATTEVRSAIDEIKHTYQASMAARNPGKIRTKKKWVHHPELSKEPRPGHRATGGKTAEISEKFQVPVYERVGTIKSGPNKGRAKWRRTGEKVLMLHPHDPEAPISESASCHCELDYFQEVIPPAVKKDDSLLTSEMIGA